jgi:hypothetical protein
MTSMGEESGLPFDEKKEETSSEVQTQAQVQAQVQAQAQAALVSSDGNEEIKKLSITPMMPSSNAKKPTRQDFKNAGLSELSKQLRIFQAKNEGQWIEINRLERQLRILADLQGISVADLRQALQDACANEAFGELQHRVASLRAQLEAAHLAKQAELKKDAAAHQIATLELRIGELEEVEDVKRDEIRNLYEQLRQEKARSMRLESSLEHQQSETQDLKKQLAEERARANRLQALGEEQRLEIKSLKANPPPLPQAAEHLKSMGGAQEARERSNMQKEYEQRLGSVRDEEAARRRKMQAEHDTITELFKKKANEIREMHVTMQVDQEQMALTIKELKDAQKQYELREAQYKARFTVQEERIKDLDQQLISLYTAFQLLREEHDAEAQSRRDLKNNLDEADAQVARQVEDFEKQGQEKSFGSPLQTSSTTNRPMMVASPAGTSVRYMSSPATSYVPSTPPPPVRGKQLDYPSTPSTLGSPSARSLMATTPKSSGGPTLNTWQILGTPGSSSKSQSVATPQGAREMLMTGTLLVRSKSMIKKWKSKSSALFLKFTHFQWDLDGKSHALQFGVSKVEYYANYPLSFAVHVNPYDKMAPIVYAAAVNEREYAQWMAALTRATTGEDYTLSALQSTTPGSPQRSGVVGRPTSLQASSRSMSSASASRSISSAEEQEANELEIALQLSQQEK